MQITVESANRPAIRCPHLVSTVNQQRPVWVARLAEPRHRRVETHLAAQPPEVSAVLARHQTPVDDTRVRRPDGPHALWVTGGEARGVLEDAGVT